MYISSAPHKRHTCHRQMEQKWLRDLENHLHVFSGGTRCNFGHGSPSSLAIDFSPPPTKKINVRYLGTYCIATSRMSGCATACKPICLYFALTADIINLIFEYHEKSIIVFFLCKLQIRGRN